MIEEALAALREGDYRGVERFAHPDIELDLSRRILNPDVYKGFDEIGRFRAEVAEIWEAMLLDAQEVIENGDKVFIRFRGRLRGKGSGITTEANTFHVWTLRDGLIARIVVVPERDEAEELAGLR